MPEVPLDQIPESRRIEGETEFARVRGVARRTVIRWVKDESPKATWARGSNGRHVFDALRSLSFPAFQRWQAECRAAEAVSAHYASREQCAVVRQAEYAGGKPCIVERAGHMPLAFPQTEGQRALSELKARLYRINPTLYEGIEQRFLLIEPRINHKWSQEARTRTEYVKLVARRAGPHGGSAATIWRLFKNYSSGLAEAGMTAALEALRKNTSGPERGAGSRLDDSMKAIVTRLWLQGKTREQCYEGMMAELREKCRVLGATWVYDAPEGPQKPLYYAVVGFINAPPPHGLGGERNPARHGREAVFDSAGYMDRHFEDEYSGQGWCIDEWECDGMFYLENHRRTIVIPYIVSVIDERGTKILGWRLSPSLDAETVLDLMEELVRREGPPRFLVSDRLGHYRRMLQRKKVLARKAELAERLAGPLEALGVTNRGPKREKNPRGNRIERMHGIYSDLARRDFGPSWREPLEGKHKIRRVDEAVKRHLRDHCKLGISGPQLLSFERAERIVTSWMEEINFADTEANGCHGMSRQAAYLEFQPAAPRERPSQAVVDLVFSQKTDRVVRAGGVIEISEHERYSSPQLLGRTGEKAMVVRYRRDRSHAFVHLEESREGIEAALRVPVGTKETHRRLEETAKLNEARAFLAREEVPLPAFEDTPEEEAQKIRAQLPASLAERHPSVEQLAPREPRKLRPLSYFGEDENV